MADPINPRMKLRASTSASLVEVPAESEFWEPRDVPHGAVEINWEKSKAINGETRAIWIYTPPGYQKDSQRYPVLYLLHGSNDTAAGWTMAGNANFVADNLLADKKMVPMIIVMPWGHATPFGTPGNDALFENYVLQDVIPTVEAKYRVAPGRQNRAIAGLSMGGGQSLRIGLGHLDLFSAVASFSGAIPADFETQFAGPAEESAVDQREAEGAVDRVRPAGLALSALQESLRSADKKRREAHVPRHRWSPQLHRLAEVSRGVHAAAVPVTFHSRAKIYPLAHPISVTMSVSWPRASA